MLDWVSHIQQVQALVMRYHLNQGSEKTDVRLNTTLQESLTLLFQSVDLELSKKSVARLLQLPGNSVCADCGAKGTHVNDPQSFVLRIVILAQILNGHLLTLGNSLLHTRL